MGKFKKILGFTALALAMFMGTLDSTIINIALPDIMTYFKSSFNDTSWISTIYVLGLSVFMIPGSKLADQFGRKKIMLIGLVVFGGSSALCSLSKTLIFLITMRFIQGIGGAIITPIVVPMAVEVFGEKNTQKVAGAVGAVTAVAAAGGPPIGGVLIKYISWQAIFFVNVPFALIAVILTLFFIKESYDKTVSKKIDWFGMVLLTSALFLLTFALLKGNDYGWSSTVIIAMFIGSAVSAALFLLTESKSKAPLVELGLFREFTFTSSNICYLITGFGIVAPLMIFNFFLQNALGYDALGAAYIVMAVSLTVIVSMPLGSAIAGKLGARPINFCGLLFMGGGALLLSRLTVNTSKFAMIADMIVFGFGLGFSCQSLVSSIKHLPTEKNGIGSGIVNAARQIGTCIGIAILVTILNTNVTNAKYTIKNDAIASVNSSSIVSSVKTVMTKDINDSFKTSENSDSSTDIQKNLQSKLKTDLEKSLSSASDIPKPTGNETLEKLYDGSSFLSGGISKASEGQKKLNSGISLLHSGLFTLYDGTTSLTSGAKRLNSGISQTLTGAQTLSLGSQKLSSLTSGLTALSNGLGQLFAQFSNTSSGNTTLKDKIDALNSGAHQVYSGSKSLASGTKQVSDGTAALKAQFSSGISSSPTLSDRISTLNNGTQKYVGTSNSVMKALRGNSAVYNSIKASLVTALSASAKDKVGIQSLTTTLVLITDTNSSAQVASTTGILGSEGVSANAAYLTAQQQNYDNGGAALASGTSALEAQTKSSTNGTATLYDQINALNSGAKTVTSGANTLADGASQVNGGTAALDKQMMTGGNGSHTLYDTVSALSSGANQVKSGTDQLVSGTSQLGQLQSGFSSLISALEELKAGSSVINSGSQRLQNGTSSALNGANQSVSGSSQLVGASNQLNSGASDLVNGVGKAGQAAAIQNVINCIKSDKDNQTTIAFDNTFLIAAIALIALSVFGLFTDKKVKGNQ